MDGHYQGRRQEDTAHTKAEQLLNKNSDKALHWHDEIMYNWCHDQLPCSSSGASKRAALELAPGCGGAALLMLSLRQEGTFLVSILMTSFEVY